MTRSNHPGLSQVSICLRLQTQGIIFDSSLSPFIRPLGGGLKPATYLHLPILPCSKPQASPVAAVIASGLVSLFLCPHSPLSAQHLLKMKIRIGQSLSLFPPLPPPLSLPTPLIPVAFRTKRESLPVTSCPCHLITHYTQPH